MPTKGQHKRSVAQRVNNEAEKVAKQMYSSLMLKTAPKATPQGYIVGATIVLKALIDQAVQQGSDKEQLRAVAIGLIQDI
jgi:hypothetical protein